MEESRHYEEKIKDLADKLEASLQTHLKAMQLAEGEKKKERTIRESLEDQIKKLEAYNAQLRQLKNNAKEEEASEAER